MQWTGSHFRICPLSVAAYSVQGCRGSGVYQSSVQHGVLHIRGWPWYSFYNQPGTLGEKHIKNLLKQRWGSIHSAKCIPNELRDDFCKCIVECFFPIMLSFSKIIVKVIMNTFTYYIIYCNTSHHCVFTLNTLTTYTSLYYSFLIHITSFNVSCIMGNVSIYILDLL